MDFVKKTCDYCSYCFLNGHNISCPPTNSPNQPTQQGVPGLGLKSQKMRYTCNCRRAWSLAARHREAPHQGCNMPGEKNNTVVCLGSSSPRVQMNAEGATHSWQLAFVLNQPTLFLTQKYKKNLKKIETQSLLVLLSNENLTRTKFGLTYCGCFGGGWEGGGNTTQKQPKWKSRHPCAFMPRVDSGLLKALKKPKIFTVSGTPLINECPSNLDSVLLWWETTLLGGFSLKNMEFLEKRATMETMQPPNIVWQQGGSRGVTGGSRGRASIQKIGVTWETPRGSPS